MNTTRPPEAGETSLTQDLLYASRYYLGNRRGLLALAGLALAGGLALSWGWLAAAGLAPILIGVLPCLAMCALGLCMHRGAGTSCAPAADGQQPGERASEATTGIRAASPLGQSEPRGGRLASSGLAAAPPAGLEPRASTDGRDPG